jgi:hypothetical protein
LRLSRHRGANASMMYIHALAEDSPLRRATGLVLFVLPIGYTAEILSVAVHEILGHGLSAALLGGTFSGFVLKWDAMGWAFCGLPPTAPLAHQVLYLASGVIATTVCGVIFLGLTFFFRRRPDIQLALLVVSLVCLMDGIPYVLWNAYHPVLPGDIGWIISLCREAQLPGISAIRWGLFTVSAFLFAGVTLVLCVSIFVRLEALVLDGRQFTGRSRVLALLCLLVVPGWLGWFMFDWNQLIPGIGMLPDFVGAFTVVTAAAVLFWYRPRLEQETPVGAIAWHHVALSWMCLMATMLALGFWFQEGVQWG